MGEGPPRLPGREEELLLALRRRQRANGAFLATPGWAPLAAGAWAAYALDRAGEVERVRAFHRWAAELIRRAGAERGEAAWLPLGYGPRAVRRAADLPGGRREWVRAGGAVGLWLWTLARHLAAEGAAAVPGRLARPVRQAVDGLLALVEEMEAAEEPPDREAGGGAERAGRAAAWAAVYGGLNAMDRWFAIPPLAARLVDVWRKVQPAFEEVAAGEAPADARAPLLAAGFPFDVVDARGRSFLRLLARQGEEPLGGRQDAPGLALEAWLLACLGRRDEAELRWLRLAEMAPEPEAGLVASALTLLGLRARPGVDGCP
ncbi:MAG: hypothetical protein QJR14_03850 [Bacillota bacterium]|nr:hypothetical protein [Bacillota bacterium]